MAFGGFRLRENLQRQVTTNITPLAELTSLRKKSNLYAKVLAVALRDTPSIIGNVLNASLRALEPIKTKGKRRRLASEDRMIEKHVLIILVVASGFLFHFSL